MRKIIPILALFFLIIIPSSTLKAQSKINIGGYIGGGFISGNLPSVGSLSTSLFIEANTQSIFGFDTRLSFIFNTDFNRIFPRASFQYYPFIKGFSLKGIVYQQASNIFYIEEGIGPLVINDRSLVELNTWNYGIVFSIAAGTNFGNPNSVLHLSAGVEYGLTFTNTDVKYSSFYVQAQIYL